MYSKELWSDLRKYGVIYEPMICLVSWLLCPPGRRRDLPPGNYEFRVALFDNEKMTPFSAATPIITIAP